MPAKKYVCVYLQNRPPNIKGACVWCPYNNTMANFDVSSYLDRPGVNKDDLTVWEMHGSLANTVQTEKGQALPAPAEKTQASAAVARPHLPQKLMGMDMTAQQDWIITVVTHSGMYNVSRAGQLAAEKTEKLTIDAIHKPAFGAMSLQASVKTAVAVSSSDEPTNQAGNTDSSNFGDMVATINGPKPPPPPPDPVGPFYSSHCMCPEACHPYLGTYQGCMDWCKRMDGQPGGYLAFIPKGQYTVTYSSSLRTCSCCGEIDPCKAPR
jgi:hypothetical protein